MAAAAATGPRPLMLPPTGGRGGPRRPSWVLQPRLRAGGDELVLRWSPQQIAGWLPLAFPEDPVMRVSRETVYLSLFAQSRGALRRELQRCLRTGRAMRYPRASACPRAAVSQIGRHRYLRR